MKISRNHDLVFHRSVFRRPVDAVRRMLNLPVREDRDRTVIEEVRPFDIRRRAPVPIPTAPIPPQARPAVDVQASTGDLLSGVFSWHPSDGTNVEQVAEGIVDATLVQARSNLQEGEKKAKNDRDRVDRALKVHREIPSPPIVGHVVFNTRRIMVHEEESASSSSAAKPSADVDSRLHDFVDAENLKSCARDKTPGLDPAKLDLSAFSDDLMAGLADEIQLSGLMHVTHGSKPVFLMEPGHPLVSVIQDLQERHILKDDFAVVASSNGEAYLVNKQNLRDTLHQHGPELKQRMTRALDIQAQEPGKASAAAGARQRLENRTSTTNELVSHVLLAMRTGMGLSDEVLGTLLGYGARNASHYQLRSQGGDEGVRLYAEQRSAKSTAVMDEINAPLADPHGTFPKPPSFLTWDDQPGPTAPETSALLTRYLNESLDMSEGPLKQAYESPEAFRREAPRVFLGALFVPE